MAELKRRVYQLWGEERDKILEKFKKRITEWGITMPPGDLQVLDFGLGRYYETGLIESWVANQEDEGYCGKFLFVFDSQECPSHYHPFKHETFFVLKGKILARTDDVETTHSEGDVITLKPGTRHLFKGIGDALIIEFSKPCRESDNIFDDKSIGEDGVL